MTLVCDVMATCLEAAVAGRSLDVASSAERPAPLPSAASAASFDGVEAEAAQGAEAPLHRGEHAVRRDPRHEAAEHLARAVVALGVASRLGQHLRRQGRAAEGDRWLGEATRRHPDSWCIWRQSAGVNEQGFAALPDFWARVDALGDDRYYPRVDMAGMP